VQTNYPRECQCLALNSQISEISESYELSVFILGVSVIIAGNTVQLKSIDNSEVEIVMPYSSFALFEIGTEDLGTRVGCSLGYACEGTE